MGGLTSHRFVCSRVPRLGGRVLYNNRYNNKPSIRVSGRFLLVMFQRQIP